MFKPEIKAAIKQLDPKVTIDGKLSKRELLSQLKQLLAPFAKRIQRDKWDC